MNMSRLWKAFKKKKKKKQDFLYQDSIQINYLLIMFSGNLFVLSLNLSGTKSIVS